MAKPGKRTRERIGSSPSCFLGCFGFSGKRFSEKLTVSPNGGERKRKKKKNRWFSWSGFRLKKGEIKPSPIDDTEKWNSNTKKVSDKHKTVPVISCMTDRRNIPVDDKAAKLETEQTKTNKPRDIILDRSRSPDPVSSSKSDTCQNRISTFVCGKPDPNKTGPTPMKSNRVGKFDPFVGISIIMLTLAIMVIWGRMCAILCASAWCYFLPRVRDAAKRKRISCIGGRAESGMDLSSEAYKKKVILEGLLGRQNRVSL